MLRVAILTRKRVVDAESWSVKDENIVWITNKCTAQERTQWLADAQNNKTVKSPYYFGRNLCVRGRGHKPLSLWCPEACGCHRGDQDCPLQCPERDATTPICPAHQRRTFLPGCPDEFSPELCCPRHPRAYHFDVGFSSVGTSGTAWAAAAGD